MPSSCLSLVLLLGAAVGASLTLVTAESGPTAEPSDSKVVVLTAKTFDKFIRKNELVLMEFYAPWCGHCQQMAPVFREAAKQMEKLDLPMQVKFAKMDDSMDSNRVLRAGAPEMYNYTSYPTLMIFRGDPSPGVPIDPLGEKWWERSGKTYTFYQGGRDKPEDFTFYMSALAKGLDPKDEEQKLKPGLYRGMTSLMYELDEGNFNKTVLNEDTANNRVWIIEFYSDHCHFCKGLKKDFIKAAKRGYKDLAGKVRFGAVNSRVFQPIADVWGITSYPWVTSIYQGKKLEDMAGLGGEDSIVEWATRKVGEEWKKDDRAESGGMCAALGGGLQSEDVAVGASLSVVASEDDVVACVAEKGKEWYGKTAKKRRPLLGAKGVVKEVDAEKGVALLTFEGDKEMWWGFNYLAAPAAAEEEGKEEL